MASAAMAAKQAAMEQARQKALAANLAALEAWLRVYPHARRVQTLTEGFVETLDEAKELGSGGFGSVLRLTKKCDSTTVAMKVIKKTDICSTEKDLRHMQVEITVLRDSSIQSNPYIIKLYNVVYTDDHIGLIMEQWGPDLHTYMHMRREKNDWIKHDEALLILKQLLTGLERIHALGVVHRDIKPENILIDPETKVIKIIDFGIAKVIRDRTMEADTPGGMGINALRLPSPKPSDQHTEAVLTPGGSVTIPASPMIAATPCGTNLYKSLELLEGELASIKASMRAPKPAAWYTTKTRLTKVDVYSAGVIAYVLLVGELPFYVAYKEGQKVTRTQQLISLKKKLEATKQNVMVVFRESARQSLPPDAVTAIGELMTHNAIQRPTASQALSLPWLQSLTQLPRANPSAPGGIINAKSVTAVDKSAIKIRPLGIKKPGGKSKSSKSPTAKAVASRTVPPPVKEEGDTAAPAAAAAAPVVVSVPVPPAAVPVVKVTSSDDPPAAAAAAPVSVPIPAVAVIAVPVDNGASAPAATHVDPVGASATSTPDVASAATPPTDAHRTPDLVYFVPDADVEDAKSMPSEGGGCVPAPPSADDRAEWNGLMTRLLLQEDGMEASSENTAVTAPVPAAAVPTAAAAAAAAAALGDDDDMMTREETVPQGADAAATHAAP